MKLEPILKKRILGENLHHSLPALSCMGFDGRELHFEDKKLQELARMFVEGGGGKVLEATDTELFQLPMFGSQPIGSVACFNHQRYEYDVPHCPEPDNTTACASSIASIDTAAEEVSQGE